ncbi:MAG: single-stranded DNA-binding protein [Pleurocapsa sp.]
MNSCVLMVEIVGDAQMRQTPDGLMVTDVLVEFEGTREGDPAGKIKLVAWGNLAEELKNNYHHGDRLIVDGRLGMNLIEIDGYKEKRAELIASHLHSISSSNFTPTASSKSEPVLERSSDVVTTIQPEPVAAKPSANTATTPIDIEPVDNPPEGDWDEIPFVRPIYSRTNLGLQLCDSWELEANRYWDGIKQFV